MLPPAGTTTVVDSPVAGTTLPFLATVRTSTVAADAEVLVRVRVKCTCLVPGFPEGSLTAVTVPLTWLLWSCDAAAAGAATATMTTGTDQAAPRPTARRLIARCDNPGISDTSARVVSAPNSFMIPALALAPSGR